MYDKKILENKTSWINIQEKSFKKIILKSFGDFEKKTILNAILESPKVISEIIQEVKIPSTTVYRKIKSLQDDGLIVSKTCKSEMPKSVKKYVSTLKAIKINFDNKEIIVNVQLYVVINPERK